MTQHTYDGLPASAYLEREFAAPGKPADCTCAGYPRIKVRNGIGHPDSCPTWHRLAPAYYECRGCKYLGLNDKGHILLSKLPPQLTHPVYETVQQRITDGTITVADFNNLIEATDKSTRERVYRQTRATNPEPGKTNMAGRVVPKRDGHNDPPRQGRGRRYAAGTPAKERQNADQRRRMNAELSEALQVIMKHSGADPQTILGGPIDSIKNIRATASALLRSPNIRRLLEERGKRTIDENWLYTLVQDADTRLLAENVLLEHIRPVTLVVG